MYEKSSFECLENGISTTFILNAPQTSEATIFEHKILTINSCCLFLDWVDKMVGCDLKLVKKLCIVWKH